MRGNPDEAGREPPRWQRAIVVLLGVGDLLTGVLLVVSPAAVWYLLQLGPIPQGSAIFVRWIGVFVAAVGAAYLLPFRRPRGPERLAQMRATLEWTTLVRLAVAAFVGTGVITSALPDSWCFVGGYDAISATGQLALLAAWSSHRAL